MNHKVSRYIEAEDVAERGSQAGGKEGRVTRIIGLSAILVLARPTDAFAYVDPSIGGYLLQIILAGILSAAVGIRMFWKNIKLFFQKIFSGSDTDETDKKKSTR